MLDFDNYNLHFARMGIKPPDYEEVLKNPKKYACKENWLPKNKEVKILDIACGWGNTLLSLYSAGYSRLQGIDISKGQCEIAKRYLPPEIEIICGDAIKFLENIRELYDVIIIFQLLEHLLPDISFNLLSRVRRALKKSGMLVVRVPNMANILAGLFRYIDLTHVTGYTEWSLFQLLDAAGFHKHEVIKPSTGFKVWLTTSSWRSPLAGLGLREALNSWVHRFFYALQAGWQPRPTVFSHNLTVRTYPREIMEEGSA
jgi:2-polyprenyl-3-methyl-5-hydroxy-6-metoxy-1,4-benzoquinol methylase